MLNGREVWDSLKRFPLFQIKVLKKYSEALLEKNLINRLPSN